MQRKALYSPFKYLGSTILRSTITLFQSAFQMSTINTMQSQINLSFQVLFSQAKYTIVVIFYKRNSFLPFLLLTYVLIKQIYTNFLARAIVILYQFIYSLPSTRLYLLSLSNLYTDTISLYLLILILIQTIDYIQV